MDALLTAKEAAKILRCHPRTLTEEWRRIGFGPPALPMRGKWMYRAADVHGFIEQLAAEAEEAAALLRELDEETS